MGLIKRCVVTTFSKSCLTSCIHALLNYLFMAAPLGFVMSNTRQASSSVIGIVRLSSLLID